MLYLKKYFARNGQELPLFSVLSRSGGLACLQFKLSFFFLSRNFRYHLLVLLSAVNNFKKATCNTVEIIVYYSHVLRQKLCTNNYLFD